MKKRMALLTFLALLLPLYVSKAQSEKKRNAEKVKPDFSGTWKRDNLKSDFGVFKRRPYAKSNVTMTIDQDGSEFRLTRKIEPENGAATETHWLYFMDGRGETNAAVIGDVELKSRTSWRGKKLAWEDSKDYRRLGDYIHLYVMEEWSLSSDGKTLSDNIYFNRTTTTKLGGGDMIHDENGIIRQVFNRLEK